jgi:3-deoxy-7-phosphoheptulonate synthase
MLWGDSVNYTVIKKLPPIESILQGIPLSDKGFAQIHQDRKEIQNILAGRDNRLLVITGPCSAWPHEAVIEYAQRLKQLSMKINDHIKIVMRVYVQKPRTRHGWLGPVNQPDPLSNPDIEGGIRYVRRMMMDVINMGLPIAGEALFTHNSKCFIELLSWVAVGARSSEDQEHRIFASSIDCAVGLKNPTHGSLDIALNSIIVAQHPHVCAFDGYEVQTHGNPYAHLVLRGGNSQPNYTIDYLQQVLQLINNNIIKHPALLIDASHDNCIRNGFKQYQKQAQVIEETLASIDNKPELQKLIKGFMIESFIHEGSQKIDPACPDDLTLTGLSLTDPCLGWETTESLLLELAQRRK